MKSHYRKGKKSKKLKLGGRNFSANLNESLVFNTIWYGNISTWSQQENLRRHGVKVRKYYILYYYDTWTRITPARSGEEPDTRMDDDITKERWRHERTMTSRADDDVTNGRWRYERTMTSRAEQQIGTWRERLLLEHSNSDFSAIPVINDKKLNNETIWP